MVRPINIPVVNDLTAGAVRTNILAGIPQRVVAEDSKVDVALSRESADVTLELQAGNEILIPGGSPCNIVATVGSLPRFDQDGVGSFLVAGGEELALFGSNANAAAQELRAQIRITPLDDTAVIAGPQG